MTDASLLAGFLSLVSDPKAMMYLAGASIMGIIFGSVPGLTATMAVALLIPFTFAMTPEIGLGVLICAYVSGIAAGAISAILLNIPGSPASMCTTMDGHPMARQGRAGEALGLAVIASLFGTLVSFVALVVLAPQLARVALNFGPPEYAMLAVFGLSIVSRLLSGNIVRGLIAAMIGISLSFIGFDPLTGSARYTFGSYQLLQGISILPALIGIFVIPEVLQTLHERFIVESSGTRLRQLLPSGRLMLKEWANFIRSSVIGVVVGILPAVGSNVAAFLAYDQSKRLARDSKSYGKGAPGGIIAAESANNGVTGGSMIPLLTLGIPGDSVTAVMLGGLMIHGIQPGPRLFTENPALVNSLFASLFIAAILMALFQLIGMRFFARVILAPKEYIVALLLVLAVLGSYSIKNSWVDVWAMLGLGTAGYILSRVGFPMIPIVLGLVLGPLLESELRRSLVISSGDWSVFLTRPLAALFLFVSVLFMVGPTLLRSVRNRFELKRRFDPL
ncbi:tripartite tricarboxylate transporter permease [Stutzerimonas azotifigens]|uniref:tripartite tricarboxylate transporter permease n=1 Tax=Stutzerimonas azotifigens TaxID=291995 RepID=UPI0003F7EF7C|nr:tripartite tricarboxylate transporter permease [Stutzerimonas azotifigens]